MADRMVVFDMDGVLVDVTESYRETIQQTVEHFTGKRVSRETIQDWKNRGGWNNDWALSTAMIREAGLEIDYDTVVEYFQSIFHGENGLILREQWIAKDGVLEKLHKDYRFTVFTGRTRWEAQLTLDRFGNAPLFEHVLGADDPDVQNHKPAPDGLLYLGKKYPDTELWYVGDTVDDARCAKAAKVPFIGIATPANNKRDELVALLNAEGARAVLEDINQLEEALHK